MRRKNPFRIIRIVAATLGSVALLGLFGFIAVGVIAMMIEESGPHILWQFPLALAVVIGIVTGIAFICSLIARLWRNAERNWDRKGKVR